MSAPASGVVADRSPRIPSAKAAIWRTSTSGSLSSADQRLDAFGEPDAADGERGPATDAAFAVAEHQDEVGHHRQHRHAGARGRHRGHRRRRAQDPLVLEPQNPGELLLPRAAAREAPAAPWRTRAGAGRARGRRWKLCASRWCEADGALGGAGQAIGDGDHAGARAGRHRDRCRPAATSIGGSIRSGGVVAPAGGDVAGQREVRERRQVDVVRAADARLEHPAVPDRHAGRRADVVHADRLGVAADAARLDVDDAAGARARWPRARPASASGSTRRGRSASRIRRCSAAWSSDVVVVERLLDHHQVERVERREVRRRRRACRRRWRRPSAGCRRTRARSRATAVDVPAGLDLDLDAPVAGGALDRRRARRSSSRRVLDADRHARRDRPAACRRGRCQSGTPCWRAYRSHAAISTAAFAMWWPRIAASAGNRSRGCAKARAEHPRRDERRDDVPRRLGRLVAVVRVVLGDALAPADRAVAFEADQHEGAVVAPAEAGLEDDARAAGGAAGGRAVRCSR